MRYDFDKPIDRWGTDSIKYEMIRESGDARMDVLPMSIADMEFATPAPILDAMAAVKACAEALEARLNAPEPEEMAIREDEI